MSRPDLNKQLDDEFFERFPYLRVEAQRALFTSPVTSLRLNSRDVEDTSNASQSGLFLTSENQIIIYGGRRNFLRKWEWLDVHKSGIDELDIRYEFDAIYPFVVVDCLHQKRDTRVQFHVPVHSNHPNYAKPELLPQFPKLRRVGNTHYSIPARDVAVMNHRDPAFRVSAAILGVSLDTLVIRSWENETVSDLTLPYSQFLGTVLQDSGHAMVWWTDDGITVVQKPKGREILPRKIVERLTCPVNNLKVSERPFIARVVGLIRGASLKLQECVCLPLSDPGAFVLVDRDRTAHSLSTKLRTQCIGDAIVFVDRDDDTCVSICPAKNANAAELTAAFRLTPEASKKDIPSAEFIMFLEPLRSADNTDAKDYPALLELDGLKFRSVVSPWLIDVTAVSVERNDCGRYWIRTDDDLILNARIDESDDLRLRRAIMHTRIVHRMNDQTGIAPLYEILNDLRVSRFLHLLFGDLLMLFDKMEQTPSPVELLNRLRNDTGDKDATKNCKALLPKMLLLAESLPALKRNLERLGVFYPYQIRSWDNVWLEQSFGADIASRWGAVNGPGQIEHLRVFVRGAQASLWRSLTEIERCLARIEPVYSEKLNASRRRATNKQFGLSSAIGLTGLIATQQWYLPAIASLNLITGLVTSLETNQQHQALLLEHGREALEWWNVFANAFHVQVHESKGYLLTYFDHLSKRDCEVYKQLASGETSAPLMNHLQTVMQERICIESEARFEQLWEGATQIRQDVGESLDRIAGTDVQRLLTSLDNQFSRAAAKG